jgi:hypothetical protein
MSDSNSAVLQRAYELIEAGQADEARFLLESVLEDEQTNPDAWWIYAHAVEDPVRARQALDQVLALDPDYPGAAELSDVLEAQYPGAAEEAREAAPILPLVPAPETTFIDTDEQPEVLAAAATGAALAGAPVLGTTLVPDADDASAEPEQEPSFVEQMPAATTAVLVEERRPIPWFWYFVAAVAVVIILALILALLRPGADTALVSGTEEANATMVAGQPTLDGAAQGVEGTEQAVIALTETAAVIVGAATEEAAATSEPMLPLATLPEAAVVTLTPLPPEQATPEAVAPTEAPPTAEEAQATAENQLVTPVLPVATLDEAALTPVIEASPVVVVPGAEALAGVMPEDALGQLVIELSGFAAPETALTTEATPIGETMVSSFCTEDGPQLRNLTRQVMDALAVRAQVMDAGMNAVGVRAVDCGTGQTLRLIAVDRGAAAAFADGTIDRELFESQWLAF